MDHESGGESLHDAPAGDIQLPRKRTGLSGICSLLQQEVRQAGRQADGKAGRRAGRKAGTQTGRKADRQAVLR